MKMNVNENNIELDFQKLDIDKEKIYILSVEVGQHHPSEAKKVLESLKKVFESAGYTNIVYMPTINGDFAIDFKEAEEALSKMLEDEKDA